MAKQNVGVDLFYDGVWNDHTTDVYTRDVIKITRGVTDPSQEATPGSAPLTLDNRDGSLNPRNPESTLYGKIGQNTPTRVRLGASDVRFTGEMAQWKPEKTVDWAGAGSSSQGDSWVKGQIAGPLRRLGRGVDPLKSALHRAMLAADPVTYWPMEDASGATFAASGLSDNKVLSPAFQVPTWANDSGLAGSASLPQLISGLTSWTTVLTGDARGQSTTAWSMSMWFKATMDTSPSGRVVRLLKWGQLPTNADDNWELNIFHSEPTATYSLSVDDSAYILVNTGPNPFDGDWHHIVVTVTQESADLRIKFYVDGVLLQNTLTTSPDYTLKPTGNVEVLHNPGFVDEATTVWMGHLGFFDRVLAANEITTLYDAGLGYVGELAGDRFTRLMDEEGVTCTIVGSAADTQPMGPQRIATLLEQLSEIERTDDGQVFEARTFLGLTLRTGASKLNQSAVLTLSYTGSEISPDPNLEPVVGDEHIRNDVTAASQTGTGRYVQETGPLNVQPPPTGVGRYTTRIDVNPEDNTSLRNYAGWRVAKGTFDGVWYEQVTVDLDAAPGLSTAAGAVDIGDLISLANLPEDEAPGGSVDHLVIGIAELLGSHRRLITYNLTPAQPFTVGIFGAATSPVTGASGFLDCGGTTTNEVLDATETGVDVLITDDCVWTHVDGNYNIMVNGEEMTVTAVSAASGSFPSRTQTLTVTRSVNGVVKTHATGQEVHVSDPFVLAL